ncbi:MAG: hypothetical protein NTZ05_11700 [Chloroflexi bacterium]|nr:hypothetical protein [Chloroflexota bacterium]
MTETAASCPPCWFLIPAANEAPSSLGTCKFCGATRWFRNSIPEVRNYAPKVGQAQATARRGKLTAAG